MRAIQAPSPENRNRISDLSEPFIRRPVMTACSPCRWWFWRADYLRLPVNDLAAVDYPVIFPRRRIIPARARDDGNNIATPLEREFMKIPGLELVDLQSSQVT